MFCLAVNAQEELSYGFKYPQDSARTKVWWFHGETIGTHEGITTDLEAFKQQGVGGVVYYDQVHGKGEGAFKVFSPEWWDELIFSAQEAKRLGLSFECNASNGYVAGGKWVTPDKSMQQLANTELVVEGGKDLQFKMPMLRTRGNWHKDVALIAIPYKEELMKDSRSVFSKDSVVSLTDPTQHIYINIDFEQEFAARSITYVVRARGKARTSSMQVPLNHFLHNQKTTQTNPKEFNGCGYRILPPIGELQVSENGVDYRTICLLRPKYQNLGGVKEQTIAFPTTKGRFFRIALHNWGTTNKADQNLTFGNVVLSSRAAVDAWQEKASLVSEIIEGDNTPAYTSADLTDFSHAIDLSSLMEEDGTVNWKKAPAGKWLVMRFFSMSNGGHTKHGRAEALGMECDKLSVEGARLQWKSYVKPIIDSIRAHNGFISGICMDSHEAGPQNWTIGFENEFKQLRGYCMKKYLPVLAGFVVGSKEESDKFLYDFRHTINDLITERYFGEFNRLCQAEGLTLTAQAVGGALCMAGDAIGVKRLVDKPQAEFWGYQTEGNYDIKDCSSAAHLYGKQIASGEAFTDVTYKHTLADIKNLADYAYAFGINEFVVCAVAYQPWVKEENEKLKINTANGRQYVLNRLNTFWPASRPFWDYQARCSWMLRQGKPISDFCIYLGDNIPCRILTHKLPELPHGYDFDAFTTDALFHRMSVKNGRIVLPDGISYSMMILPADENPLPENVQKRIEEFKQAGVAVYDPKLSNQSLVEAIQKAGLKPDVESSSNNLLYFCHRRTNKEEIYFLNNHSDKSINDLFIFNTTASAVEIWNPVSGTINPARFEIREGRTALSLAFAPRESYFVIVKTQNVEGEKPVARKEQDKDIASSATTLHPSETWTISFDPTMGGLKETVTLDKLTNWTKNDNPQIKYYSGTAVYRNVFHLKKKDKHASYQIEIPLLNSAAEVFVNGKSAGVVWCSPWNLDITPLLRKGKNNIEIHVCNSLWNRLVRDAQLPEEERVTWQTHNLAKPTDRLVNSGINGEVTIRVRP